MNNYTEKELKEILTNNLLTDFIGAYGLTVSITNERPIDVNAPIVFSMKELAKSLCEDDNKNVSECLEKSRRYIKEGEVYCYNMLLESYISSLKGRLYRGRGIIPSKYMEKLRSLERESKEALLEFNAALSSGRDISSESYKKIFKGLESLEDEILSINYFTGGPVSKKERVVNGLYEYGPLILMVLLAKYILASFIF